MWCLYDVKNFKIDFSEHIHDISFGFKWNAETVDIVDNEFVTVKYHYMAQNSASESNSEDLGIRECGEDGHLSKYYTKEALLSNFGKVYCPPHMNKDHYLEG